MQFEPRFATDTYPGLKALGDKKLLTIFFCGVTSIGLTILTASQYPPQNGYQFDISPMSIAGLAFSTCGSVGIVASRFFTGKKDQEKEGP